MSSSESNSTAEGVSLVAELNAQLRKAEEACEQYRKELSELQLRLDEALRVGASAQSTSVPSAQLESTFDAGYTRGIDGDVEDEESPQKMVKEVNSAKHRKSGEMETGTVKSRDETSAISRRALASSSDENAGLNHGDLLAEKDKIIDELKVELQESHSRRAKVEITTSQQIRDLEKSVLDAQSGNIATVNSKPSTSPWRFGDALPEGPTDESGEKIGTQLEDEIKKLKDQNSALTVYVNRIVTRLLQHDGFEDIFQNTSVSQGFPVNTMKELQQVDAALSSLRQAENGTAEREAVPPPPQSLLKRAGSIFSTKTRSRPDSVSVDDGRSSSGSAPLAPTTNDIPIKPPFDAVLNPRFATNPNGDPTTSMSIPLRRAESRRRPPNQLPNSERRGPPSGSSRPPSDQASPGGPRRTSYFGSSATSNTNSTPKDTVLSAALDGRIDANGSSRTASDLPSGTIDAPPPTTPGKQTASSASEAQTDESNTHHSNSPRSISATSSTSGDRAPTILTSNTSTGTGAGTLFTSAPNRMRPLRLVQEKQEADDAALAERKKANRSSWVGGWFTGSGSGSGGSGGGIGPSGGTGNAAWSNTTAATGAGAGAIVANKTDPSMTQPSGSTSSSSQQRMSAQWPAPRRVGSPRLGA